MFLRNVVVISRTTYSFILFWLALFAFVCC